MSVGVESHQEAARVWPLGRLEEKELLQRYGDEYRNYCERVHRFV